MWYRANLDEFAAALRRARSDRPNRDQPLHTEAFGEAGLILAVTLSLAVVVTYVARAMGWS